MKYPHNKPNKLHLVGSAERDEDSALAQQLLNSRTEIYKWEDASSPDTEASQTSWDKYARGWGQPALPTPEAIGHVSTNGVVQIEEATNVIDLASHRHR